MKQQQKVVEEPEIILKCRKALKDFSYFKVGKFLVDVQTANVLLAVYEGLGEANRRRFTEMPLQRMCEIAWKLV